MKYYRSNRPLPKIGLSLNYNLLFKHLPSTFVKLNKLSLRVCLSVQICPEFHEQFMEGPSS